MGSRYQVGIGADLRAADGSSLLEVAVEDVLRPVAGLEVASLGEPRAELTPDDVAGFDAVVTLWQQFTPRTFEGVERLTMISRWGVGYDMIDVAACTESDVLVAITRDAVKRPVAEAILTYVLVLAKRVLRSDRLVREGRWDEKADALGLGLSGKVFGTIGVGNIGSDLVELLRPLRFGRLLAFDPYVDPTVASGLGVELVDLDTLLAESDFVSVNCPLTPSTHHLLGADEFARMKSTAFLVNTARGPIVDEAALIDALRRGSIAGAGLDVFEEEPLPTSSPLCGLDNVVLSPHSIAWTDELVVVNGLHACENVVAVLRGDVPPHLVNPEVIERPGFQAKLERLRERWDVDH